MLGIAMMMETWIASLFPEAALSPALATALTLVVILALGVIAYRVTLRFVEPLVHALTRKTPGNLDARLVEQGFFRRLFMLVPAITLLALGEAWLVPTGPLLPLLRTIAYAWLLLAGVSTLFAFVDACSSLYHQRPSASQMPLHGLIQALKIVVAVIAIIILLSMLLGKSPALLVSGLGAMTAVLTLVFKDSILGFVAGIQLSANRMLAVGDWIEMPKYQADGDVIEIALTTVKVRNWDKTITTIPTYALIADSFKNWRGMQQSGGRRIKRSLFIDMQTVRFLNDDDIARLRRAQLIADYIEKKIAEIDSFNREHNIDHSSPVNGRHLTNLGTFRAYLAAYIREHPGTSKSLISMVRQLQPTAEGLPLEIYTFTASTVWVEHEGVQADIFDHILAVVPEFGLRVFQSPAGHDMRSFGLQPPA